MDAPSLVALADLTVSAGGTMNREAAALGTPAYTTFTGRVGAVDEQLIHSGRLRPLASPDELDVRKRDNGCERVRRDPRHLLDLLLEAGSDRPAGVRWQDPGQHSPLRHISGTSAEEGRGMKASRGGLTLLALAAVGVVVTAGAVAGVNHHKQDGFKTAKPSMLTPVAPGSTVTPLITVGDTLAGGYRYESIPDGISFQTKGKKHDRQEERQ